MDWWIGFCVVAGAASALVLDYLGRRGNGKPWLSDRWPQRLVLLMSAGVFVAFCIGMTPVMFYRAGYALVSMVFMARSL